MAQLISTHYYNMLLFNPFLHVSHESSFLHVFHVSQVLSIRVIRVIRGANYLSLNSQISPLMYVIEY